MANKINIVCPSRGRAKNVFTKVDDLILCVASNELKEYKKYNKNLQIITHNNLSNLSKIRQFIYEKYKDVFMIDDDIVSVERLYETKKEKAYLTSKEIYNLIQNTYQNAKDLGAYLFGFNNDPSPTHYNQHKPFMFNGYINGSSFGLIKNDKLYFHKQTTACESHWINLLNAYYNRFCFIDKRFHFRQKTNSTFILDGGQTGKRTLQSEKRDTLFLKMMFGDSVELKKEQNKTKQLHKYQRVLKINL